MEMTEEQQLQSLQAEMDRLTQLESQYRKQQDITEFGISKKEAADIPLTQRMAVKALSTNPEQATNYLKSKNPSMDFIVKEGEIYGKKIGDKGSYKALDPSSLELADIADLAYDIPAGLAQGYASAVGAIPGILAFNPPLAVGGAMAAGGAASAGTESLRQLLGKAIGVNKEFDSTQIAEAGGLGAILPGLGVVASKGIKAAAPVAKQAVGRLMGMSKEEAKQMVQNPDLFYSMKDIFLGKGDAVKAQQLSRKALRGLAEDLKQVGLNENEALKASLIGTNVDVDAKTLMSMFSEIKDPRARSKAAKIIIDARKYARSQRPFQPEIATGEAEQLGVQGLKQPSQIIPSEAVSEVVPEQMGFFEPETVMKPKYTKIPQPPKAPQESLLDAYKPTEPTEAELEAYYKYKELYDAFSPRAKNPRTYNYLKDIADKPIEPDQLLAPTVAKTEGEQLSDLAEYIKAEQALKRYEAKFPQLKQAKAPELALPPTPTTEKIPAKITPSFSEYFPTEVTPFSTLLQEPLELAGKKGLPANLVRKARQVLQKEAKYSAFGTPAQRQFSESADILNVPLRKISDLQAAEEFMGTGKDLQKRILKMETSKYPIKALAIPAENADIRALMEEAAQRVSTLKPEKGKISFKDVKATVDAAKKAAELEKRKSTFTASDILKSGLGGIVGHQYGGQTGALLGGLAGMVTSPKTASYALPFISGTEQLATKMPLNYTLPLWLEMLKNKQGEKK